MIDLSWDEQECIKDGWIDFLSRRSYDCFGTVTFKTPTSAHAAVIPTKRLMRDFCKSVGVKRVNAFVVAEQHLAHGRA